MTAPRRAVCQRCPNILIDEWPTVVVTSRPGKPAEQTTLCGQCADQHDDWLSRRRPAPPLARHVRSAATVGAGRGSSAFDRLFNEEAPR
jgi:hypothetical protein